MPKNKFNQLRQVSAAHNDPFWHENRFFLRYALKTHFFGFRQTRLNGIISSSYPEVTLDTFGFPVGACLAARRAVFWPPGRILAILRESTSNFGPRSK